MNLLSLFDLTPASMRSIIAMAGHMKAAPGSYRKVLQGKALAMIFEKPSLRTRVTFEVGIGQLGGQAVYLDANMVGPGKRESVEDIARNLACWTQGIVARVYRHETLERLTAAGIPVVNALCDTHHPCQTLADLLTIQERYPIDISVVDILYVGDGNNVCQSLMVGAAALNLKLTVVTPPGYEPDEAILTRLNHQFPGHQVKVQHDLNEVQDADVIYTDTWLSMGTAADETVIRQAFQAYQVDSALVRRLQATTVMHCLPAHRGDEITSEVMDGPVSAVLQQAENRLYAQQAVFQHIFKEQSA